MNINGVYIQIESVRKVSASSFASYITKELYNFIEKEHKGDFSILETEDGQDFLLFLIGQYEDGCRIT